MAKQQTEDELNIKRRARRRLVGAVALTLVVVVSLPMVLDNEPKPSGKDIDLRIPAADTVGEFVPGVAVLDVVKAAPVVESAVSVSNVVASGVIATQSEKTPAPASMPPVSKPDATVKSAATPPDQSAVMPPVKSAVTPPAKVETAAVDKGKFAVQAGAFSNANTAAQQAAKLRSWGFNAYTEKINGTVRVRVGPYAERDKADKVRLMLAKHGLHPVIAVLE